MAIALRRYAPIVGVFVFTAGLVAAQTEVDRSAAGVAQALVAESVGLVDAGQVERALVLARRALAVDSQNADAHVLLGTHEDSAFELRERHFVDALQFGNMEHHEPQDVLRRYLELKLSRGQFGDVAAILRDQRLADSTEFRDMYAVAYAHAGPPWEGGALLDSAWRGQPFTRLPAVHYWLRESETSIRFLNWLSRYADENEDFRELYVHATRRAPVELRPQLADRYYRLGGAHPLPAALALVATTTEQEMSRYAAVTRNWGALLEELNGFDDAIVVRNLALAGADLSRFSDGTKVLHEDYEMYGTPSAWYLIRDGRLVRWLHDRDRGGRVDFGVRYNEQGLPRQMYLRTPEEAWNVRYLSYPVVSSVWRTTQEGATLLGEPLEPISLAIPTGLQAVPIELRQMLTKRISINSREVDSIASGLERVWTPTALSISPSQSTFEEWLWQIPANR